MFQNLERRLFATEISCITKLSIKYEGRIRRFFRLAKSQKKLAPKQILSGRASKFFRKQGEYTKKKENKDSRKLKKRGKVNPHDDEGK